MGATRFLYRPDHPLASPLGMVEIRHVDSEEAELAVAGPKHVNVVGDSHYDGTRSPIDGADISSRKKRREYMKLHGLADFDDFKGTWEKSQKERDKMKPGTHHENKDRREAIEKAWYDVTEKRVPVNTERAEVLDVSQRPSEAPVAVLDASVVPDHDKGPVKLRGDD